MNDEIQIRKIWAAGCQCQPDAGDDIVAASKLVMTLWYEWTNEKLRTRHFWLNIQVVH